MALPIFLLFLLQFLFINVIRGENLTTDYYYSMESNETTTSMDFPEITEKLTYINSKNLSGEIELKTLQILTTVQPLDLKQNKIDENASSENKQNVINQTEIRENSLEQGLLSNTKVPTDGRKESTTELMDVLGTSGTTERLIIVTPIQTVTDPITEEDFDIIIGTSDYENSTPFIDENVHDFDKVFASAEISENNPKDTTEFLVDETISTPANVGGTENSLVLSTTTSINQVGDDETSTQEEINTVSTESDYFTITTTKISRSSETNKPEQNETVINRTNDGNKSDFYTTTTTDKPETEFISMQEGDKAVPSTTPAEFITENHITTTKQDTTTEFLLPITKEMLDSDKILIETTESIGIDDNTTPEITPTTVLIHSQISNANTKQIDANIEAVTLITTVSPDSSTETITELDNRIGNEDFIGEEVETTTQTNDKSLEKDIITEINVVEIVNGEKVIVKLTEKETEDVTTTLPSFNLITKNANVENIENLSVILEKHNETAREEFVAVIFEEMFTKNETISTTSKTTTTNEGVFEEIFTKNESNEDVLTTTEIIHEEKLDEIVITQDEGQIDVVLKEQGVEIPTTTAKIYFPVVTFLPVTSTVNYYEDMLFTTTATGYENEEVKYVELEIDNYFKEKKNLTVEEVDGQITEKLDVTTSISTTVKNYEDVNYTTEGIDNIGNLTTEKVAEGVEKIDDDEKKLGLEYIESLTTKKNVLPIEDDNKNESNESKIEPEITRNEAEIFTTEKNIIAEEIAKEQKKLDITAIESFSITTTVKNYEDVYYTTVSSVQNKIDNHFKNIPNFSPEKVTDRVGKLDIDEMELNLENVEISTTKKIILPIEIVNEDDNKNASNESKAFTTKENFIAEEVDKEIAKGFKKLEGGELDITLIASSSIVSTVRDYEDVYYTTPPSVQEAKHAKFVQAEIDINFKHIPIFTPEKEIGETVGKLDSDEIELNIKNVEIEIINDNINKNQNGIETDFVKKQPEIFSVFTTKVEDITTSPLLTTTLSHSNKIESNPTKTGEEEINDIKDPQVFGLINGKNVSFTARITHNNSHYFVPPDAHFVYAPKLLNITWKSSIFNHNNSIFFDVTGPSIYRTQINIVEGKEIKKYHALINSELLEEMKSYGAVPLTIMFNKNLNVLFSNDNFLQELLNSKPDVKAPDALPTSNQTRSLTAEIMGACIGFSVIIGMLLY